nr:MAG TPA: hypothetical protein [Caudoviricetes sp.]
MFYIILIYVFLFYRKLTLLEYINRYIHYIEYY